MIKFIDTNSDEILSRMIARFEEALDTSLMPADERRIFINQLAQVIVAGSSEINYVGNQNLLRYAKSDALEAIGEMFSVSRLPASKASTVLQFTISTTQENDIIIPKGTRATPDGTHYFGTDKDLTIAAGEIYGTVTASATDSGATYNGYVAGQVKYIVDNVQFLSGVSNTTTTAGGADAESDDSLRERIQLVTESFSTAGCEGGYVFFAKSASADVGDVEVYSPVNDESLSDSEREAGAGKVFVYVMRADGTIPAANDEIITIVKKALSAKDVRPLTDMVTVSPPSAENYNLVFEYYISNENELTVASIKAAVEEAAKTYIKWQGEKIGRDINPDYLRKLVLNAGASRLNIISPEFQALTTSKIARNTETIKAITSATEAATMPTASAANLNAYYKYTGTTNATYTHNAYYQCQETSDNVFAWVLQKALIVYKGLSE